jgi:predicted nucleic acid-binding protein
MELIIDSNIIFSALLKADAPELEIIENTYKNISYCQKSTVEMFKYKEKLVKFSRLAEEDILSNYYRVLRNLRVIFERDIPADARKLAYRLCKDIDPKDTVFVAAAIFMEAYLWTGDKKLIYGLAKKGFTQTVRTADLINK